MPRCAAIILDFTAGRVWKPGDAGYQEMLDESLAIQAKTVSICIGALPPEARPHCG